MAIRRRHSVKDIGAIANGASSQTMRAPAATKGILHLKSGPPGARSTVLASPDGGTTWFFLRRPDGSAAGALTRITQTDTYESLTIPVLPDTYRVDVDTADITACQMEEIREVC